MKKIAILASHNGSTLDTLKQACNDGFLDVDIKLVISNNTNANVFTKAKIYNIDNYLVNQKTVPNPDAEIYRLLQEYKCEYVILAGYMKKISPLITTNFKVINSHPSLLPKYGGSGMYGRNVHEAVIANKEKESGVTVHEVNENYDEGKIILQKKINISNIQTAQDLETHIKELEKNAVVEALRVCLK